MIIEDKLKIEFVTEKVILFCDKHNFYFYSSEYDWHFRCLKYDFKPLVTKPYQLFYYCNNIYDCEEIIELLTFKIGSAQIGFKILKQYNPQIK